jgi:PAS domain S-box-containing protein
MTDSTLQSDLLSRTVQAERLRLHRAITASSVIFSAVLGGLLATLLWSTANAMHLLLWLATLGTALAVRVAVWRAHIRTEPRLDDSARWLRRYRLCFAAHGLSWSLVGLLLLPAASHSQFDLLSIALFAMSVGSLLATAFDVAASAAFVLPTIAPVLLYLFSRGDEGFTVIGGVILLLTASGVQSAWRTQGIVQESVRLRLAEEQAADQLRRKSDELQLTLDSIDQGIVSVDAERRVGVHNRRMLELLDLPASLLTAATKFDDIVRFQRERSDFQADGRFMDLHGRQLQAVDGGLDLPALYVRRIHSGALVEVRTRKLVGGTLVRTYTDVTAYIEALESLRQREAEQRTLLDAFPGYIAVVNEDFIYQHVNERLAAQVGIAADRVPGMHLRDVLGERAFAQLAPEFARAAAGQTTALERHYPATPGRPRIDIEVQHIAGPLKPGGKRLFYVFAMDITARKQAEAARISLEAQLQESRKLEAIAVLEAQLRESQKMQAIGTLAGGISHDFNNIIATILGNTELARQDMHANPAALESLEEIRKAASRARDLVQQILSFSRRQPTARKQIALAPVINESLRLLRATLPARVALEAQLDPDVPDVLADATQVQQVLINLVTNAAQAMHGRPGRIDIRLAAAAEAALAPATRPALHRLQARHAGGVVQMSVSDDGPGMEAATLARVFEPFFTTKPVGEGTGLGLSVVHGIVHGHEGEIAVDSNPGRGTCFTLFLPAGAPTRTSAPAPHHAAPAAPAAGVTAGRFRRLIYLDDEEALVFLVKRVLERRGWHVSAHVNQRDALDLLQADRAGFDLFVTDYNMPGMSGVEVVRAVHAIRPDLPVAIVSGFIDDELRTLAADAGVQGLIFKAGVVDDFCVAIEALLQAPATPTTMD